MTGRIKFDYRNTKTGKPMAKVRMDFMIERATVVRVVAGALYNEIEIRTQRDIQEQLYSYVYVGNLASGSDSLTDAEPEEQTDCMERAEAIVKRLWPDV